MSELDELLASYTYDEATVWETYKESFLKRNAANRDAEIQGFDKFVADTDGMATLSRSAAQLLQRKRELVSMHSQLLKLGR